MADNDSELREYKLLTLTYGTAPASFIATRCLKELAEEVKNEYPQVSKVISNDFYMDDCITGGESIDDCIQLQTQIINVLKTGCFEIRKWISNDQRLLDIVPLEDRELKIPLVEANESSYHTLGINWSALNDVFTFKISINSQNHFTERSFLSEVAKIFDPFGWLAPTLIIPKILLQKTWLSGVYWDQRLDSEIEDRWLKTCESLKDLEILTIPRFVDCSNKFEIHGFCDASIEAFAAVIYVRYRIGDSHDSRIFISKTRVAPLKTVTLPRLELCAAVLLSLLWSYLRRSVPRFTDCQFIGWTDSTVCLQWIEGHPANWKTFVANRVSEIQDNIPPSSWFHIMGKNNPADLATRGIHPTELIKSNLWWSGPEWLKSEIINYETASIENKELSIVQREKRKKQVCNLVVPANPFNELINRYSRLLKLQRVISYVYRFLFKCKKRVSQSAFITALELDESLLRIIKFVQNEVFADEIRRLQEKKSIKPKSRLLSFSIFLDDMNIIRVGGRLRHSSFLSRDQKNPILLPTKHRLTWLIIDSYHRKNLHAGPQMLSSSLRQRFWIPNSRSLCRKFVHSCVKCYRQMARSAQQFMGDLPRPRVNVSSPFTITGVDYAGPIMILEKRGKGRKCLIKSFICIFVCFTTKAIHIELVTGLSSEAFISALRRFIACRGKPNEIYSDCGTNFVGAKNLIDSLYSGHDELLSGYLSCERIEWRFNSPAAPHFGGLYEAAVKSTKYHLKRVIGDSHLLFEMNTLLCQIEACLNSRPLCELSNDPEEIEALTPGHFLIGRPLNSLPDMETNSNINPGQRWQMIQKMNNGFWRRWQNEYLTQLNQRGKWFNKENIQMGKLVPVIDQNQPPSKWILARVTSVHPGLDSLVRTVTLKTKLGVITRPIVKISPLPFE